MKPRLLRSLLFSLRLSLLLPFLLLAACPSPVCQHLKTRCAGQRLEVCDATGQWQTAIPCDGISGPEPFKCCPKGDGAGFECRKAAECND